MPDTAELAKPVAHEKYERLIKAAQTQATIKVAVAHPCDDVSLEGAVEAARLRLIDPILVGPQERIRRLCGSTPVWIFPQWRSSTRSTATIPPPRRWNWSPPDASRP